jgi:hypothetical protein
MSLEEIRQKLMEKVRAQNEAQQVAQAKSEARDDWETTNNGLRNLRRHVQKYRDEDEKRNLEAYIRQRRAKEDASWMNPYGMLDNQEINISRNTGSVFSNSENFFVERHSEPVGNILAVPNKFASNVKRKRR